MNEHPNRELIDNLRALADFWESRPDIGKNYSSPAICHSLRTKEELFALLPTLGKVRKRFIDDELYIYKDIGSTYVFFVIDRRHVCEAVVTEKIIPAKPEQIIPATPEKVVKVTEWHCPPSLLELAAKDRLMTTDEALERLPS